MIKNIDMDSDMVALKTSTLQMFLYKCQGITIRLFSRDAFLETEGYT